MPELPKGFLDRPVAHRGLHGANRPENSLAAAEAAVEHGYGIEIDIQISADSVAMVFHDETLSRMTAAQGRVCEHSADELSQIRLANREGIPTLAALLDRVNGRVPVLIEVKDQSQVPGSPGDEALANAVCETVRSHAKGDVAVMSYNPHIIAHCAKFLPELTRGLVTCSFEDEEFAFLTDEQRQQLKDIVAFDWVGASFISHDREDLASQSVAKLRERGVPMLCWTIRDADQAQEALKFVDNITFENYLP